MYVCMYACMCVCVILRIYNYQFLSHLVCTFLVYCPETNHEKADRFPRLASAIYPLAGRCGLRHQFSPWSTYIHMFIYLSIYIYSYVYIYIHIDCSCPPVSWHRYGLNPPAVDHFWTGNHGCSIRNPNRGRLGNTTAIAYSQGTTSPQLVSTPLNPIWLYSPIQSSRVYSCIFQLFGLNFESQDSWGAPPPKSPPIQLGHPGGRTGDSQSGLHGSQFDVHSAEKWLGGCQHLQLSGEAAELGAAGT